MCKFPTHSLVSVCSAMILNISHDVAVAIVVAMHDVSVQEEVMRGEK